MLCQPGGCYDPFILLKKKNKKNTTKRVLLFSGSHPTSVCATASLASPFPSTCSLWSAQTANSLLYLRQSDITSVVFLKHCTQYTTGPLYKRRTACDLTPFDTFCRTFYVFLQPLHLSQSFSGGRKDVWRIITDRFSNKNLASSIQKLPDSLPIYLSPACATSMAEL